MRSRGGQRQAEPQRGQAHPGRGRGAGGGGRARVRGRRRGGARAPARAGARRQAVAARGPRRADVFTGLRFLITLFLCWSFWKKYKFTY